MIDWGNTCELLLDVVALQPYWVLFLQIVIFFILSCVWNLIKLSCSGNNRNLISNEKNWSNTILRPNLRFLFLQSLINWGHTIYILSSLNYLGIESQIKNDRHTAWDIYQTFVARILNSGFPSLLCSWLIYTISFFSGEMDSSEERPTFAFLFTISTLPMFIPMITHAVVGFVVYLPLWMIPLAMAHCIRKCLTKRKTTRDLEILGEINLNYTFHDSSGALSPIQSPDDLQASCRIPLSPSTIHSHWSETHKQTIGYIQTLKLLFFKLSLALGLIGFFQIASNYAILLYSGNHYLSVILREWELRNTPCYLDRIVEDTQTIAAFLSYL